MNMYAMHTAAAALFALSAFASSAQDPAWVADARKVAGSVPSKLLAVLNEEMAKGGPEGAIAVCREKAPELAKAASAESGWAIRRVSLKNRNPKAVPDAWERAALEDFDRRAAGGESPATIEKAEVVVVEGKETYRYMKALPVQPLCVTCHGPADQLSPALKEKLKALYPDDKGVGYSPGQIRGAITLKKPV
jgi:mono/diheme cytochrome c family protein